MPSKMLTSSKKVNNMNLKWVKKTWLCCLGACALVLASFADAQMTYYYRDALVALGAGGNGMSAIISNPTTNLGGREITISGNTPTSYVSFTFRGPAGNTLTTGEYLVDNPLGRSGVDSQPSIYMLFASCETRKGRFNIRELVSNALGQVTALAIDFERSCSTLQDPTFSGQIRFNSTIPIDTVKRTPNAILFTDQKDIPIGSVVTSNTVTISGLDIPATLSITGGEYSINGGTFSTASTTVMTGDTVRIRLNAPSALNQQTTATLQINGYNTRFRVATPTGANPQPLGESLVSLFGLPQLNGTAKTVVFSPGNLHTITLEKSSYFPERAIKVTVVPNDTSNNNYYSDPWLIELASTGGQVAVGQQTGLQIGRVTSGAYFTYTSGDPGCSGNQSSVSVNVLEISYAPDGIPTKLALDYVIECGVGSTYSRLYGHVRVNSTVAIDYSIKKPIPFLFPSVKDATLNTLYTSAIGSAQGITEPVAISVQGGEYSINNGAFRTDASTISNGQSVKVRLTSANTSNTLKTAILTMGGVEYPFRVGTAVSAAPQPSIDPLFVTVGIPATSTQAINTEYFSPAKLNRFSASRYYSYDKSNQILVYPNLEQSQYESLVFTLVFSAADGSYLTPGQYQINSGNDGQQPTFNFWSSSSNYQCFDKTSMKLIVHEVEYGADDIVTKLAADVISECSASYSNGNSIIYRYIRYHSAVPIDYTRSIPASFRYSPALGVAVSSTNTSSPATIYGINTAIPVSVVGGEYAIDSGAFTSVPGTIADGQTLRLRGIASATSDTLSEVTVTVGTRTAAFKIGTAPDTKPQPRVDSPLIVMYGQARNGTLTQRVLSDATLVSISAAQGGPYTALLSLRTETGITNIANADLALNSLSNELTTGSYTDNPGMAGSAGHYSIHANFGNNLPACSNPYSGPILPPSTKFVVHEIERTVTGQLIKLAADIVETCAFSLPNPEQSPMAAVFSFIRFNSAFPISHAITEPVPVVFSPLLRQVVGATVESNTVTILGISEPVSISIESGNNNFEYSIDGGAYTKLPSTISAGKTLKLRTSAPASLNSYEHNKINIGSAQPILFVGTDLGLGPNTGGHPIIYLQSQGNDYVGRGNSFEFGAPLQHRITSTVYNYSAPTSGAIRIEVFDPAYSSTFSSWSFNFANVNHSPLVVGTYDNPRFSSATSPFMNIWGGFTVCTEIDPGSKFTVREIAFNGPTIDKLAIDFVQYCASNPDPLYGYIRINSSIPITPVADADPAPFSIAPANNVLRNTPVTSASVLVSGFTVAAPISITGGEYSLDSGAFTSAPGIMNPGQSIRVRVTSPANFNASTTAVVNIGTRSANFVASTGYQDTFPDSLEFATVTNVPRNSLVTSAIMTVNDINDTAMVVASSTGVEFSVAGQPFTSSNTPLQPGQTLQLRLRSASTYNTLTYTYVTVGNKGVSFSARTGAQAVIVATIAGAGTVAISPLNLSCNQSCSSLLDQGTAITLTATPNASTVFTGWSGAGCSGTGVCNITVDLTASVTATFATLPPTSPTIVQATAGNGSATFRLSPPSSNGGAAVSSYAITCMPNAVTAATTGTVITVTGLTNDTPYSCTASASNSAGVSVASDPVMVTPTAAISLALTAVKSRKTHGTNLVYDIDVDPAIAQAGPVAVEPRSAGSGHVMVFQFNTSVTTVGAVSAADEANNNVAIANQVIVGNELRITLAGALDRKRVKVSVTGVNGVLDTSASVGFLLGNVSMSREVLQADISAVKARTGQAIALDNFFYDINLSGMISAADVMAIRRRLNNKLP